jgi:carbon monoxide dehydrogenase subunit G
VEQTGTYEIPAPRDAVWAALNDPEVLGDCIPGCQAVERVDEQHFTAKVKAKIGPVSASFQGEIELDDLNPPESYTLKGGAKGGAAGFGKGEAKVRLDVIDETHTQLNYELKASVGGKLAQVGSRLVDGAARKMAEEFFSAFSRRVSAQAETTAAHAASETGLAEDPGSDAGDTSAETTEAGSDRPRYESSGGGAIWIVAFVVLALAIVLAI